MKGRQFDTPKMNFYYVCTSAETNNNSIFSKLNGVLFVVKLRYCADFKLQVHIQFHTQTIDVYLRHALASASLCLLELCY